MRTRNKLIFSTHQMARCCDCGHEYLAPFDEFYSPNRRCETCKVLADVEEGEESVHKLLVCIFGEKEKR